MDLDTDNQPQWIKRIKQPSVNAFSIAKHKPDIATLECNIDGELKTYIWDSKTGKLNDLLGVGSTHDGYLSPDGVFWYFLNDEKGDEQGHWCRTRIGSGVVEDITPDMPVYSGYDMVFSDDLSTIALRIYLVEKEIIVLFKLKDHQIVSKKIIFESTDIIDSLAISSDGLLISFSSDDLRKGNKQDIVVISSQTGEIVNRLQLSGNQTAYAHAFVGNSNKLACFMVDKDSTILLWDIKTGDKEVIAKGDDLNINDVSPDGCFLLYEVQSKSIVDIYLYDLQTKKRTKLADLAGESWPVLFAGEEIFVLSTNSVEKSAIRSYDKLTGAFKRFVYKIPNSIPSSKIELVTFKGANGDDVHGWLKKPEGNGPFPAIIEVHGGPLVFNGEYYENDVFIDNGFVKLSVNYHGTRSYGREFMESIKGRIGELELEDMVAARNWLVGQGLATPDEIFLMGGSYGGYLTLWGMVRRPDLWNAGAAIVPVADWSMTHEDSTDFMKTWTKDLFGGTPDEKPDGYKKSSPVNYIENLGAPLLIIAGTHDTRCPKRPIEIFIKKARELGKNVEEFWYDEGHHNYSTDFLINRFQMTLDFFKKNL